MFLFDLEHLHYWKESGERPSYGKYGNIRCEPREAAPKMSERVLRIGIKGMKHSRLLQDFNTLTFMRKFSSLIVSNITEPAKMHKLHNTVFRFFRKPSSEK